MEEKGGRAELSTEMEKLRSGFSITAAGAVENVVPGVLRRSPLGVT